MLLVLDLFKLFISCWFNFDVHLETQPFLLDFSSLVESEVLRCILTIFWSPLLRFIMFPLLPLIWLGCLFLLVCIRVFQSNQKQNKTETVLCFVNALWFSSLFLVFVVVVFVFVCFHFISCWPCFNCFSFLSTDLTFDLFLFAQDCKVLSYYLRSLRFFKNKGTLGYKNN